MNIATPAIITAEKKTSLPSALENCIIYESNGVIGINKPSATISRSVPRLLAPIFTDTIPNGCKGMPGKPWPTHRLDKDTTGVLLLAKNIEQCEALNAQFRTRATQKTYWALATGTPKTRNGTIDTPLTSHEDGYAYLNKNGKTAITDYRTIQTRKGTSFLSLKPHTGRMHQLRAHLAKCLGTPIIGDPLYTAPAKKHEPRTKTPNSLACNFNLQGQLLHARDLRFTDPSTENEICITAPLPEERAEIWEELGFLIPEATTP